MAILWIPFPNLALSFHQHSFLGSSAGGGFHTRCQDLTSAFSIASGYFQGLGESATDLALDANSLLIRLLEGH